MIEKSERFGRSFFSLNSDGSRADLIMIPAGGYRKMSSEETVKERLVVYEKKTAPLIEYYSGLGVLKKVDGDRPVGEVVEEIAEVLR